MIEEHMGRKISKLISLRILSVVQSHDQLALPVVVGVPVAVGAGEAALELACCLLHGGRALTKLGVVSKPSSAEVTAILPLEVARCMILVGRASCFRYACGKNEGDRGRQ